MSVSKDVSFADALSSKEFRFFWFSELLNRSVATVSGDRLGKLSDLVFQLRDPYPGAVGIYMEHGWGKPTEFIPWEKIVDIGKKTVVVQPPEGAATYPPFVDQPGWILINEHLMGRTILDTDGRRVEVVNDVQMLESRARLIIIHVDVSFNGFLRKWGLGGLRWIADKFIPWRYVQPFSLEDAVKTDTVSLSITKEQAMELPGEDLADVLEMLSGEEQEAFFSALDPEKAAESLLHAEPRAKRQLIEDLPKERAQVILAELSIPQLADLFSVLPHDDVTELMQLLPEESAKRIRQLLSDQQARARDLMSSDYLVFKPGTTVGEALQTIRTSGRDPDAISYLYVVTEEGQLVGVVDLRELVLASDDAHLDDVMSSSVVAAEEDKSREDLEDIFAKYRYRMLPVVDGQDHLLGAIRYSDLMQPEHEKT
jgi:CBS domain-containing protein/sporulation protein YlmC with PRC-barrel domain